MISFGIENCTNFDKSSSSEWLETNGIGGFASSTVSGANTRRYHGLLTAATNPPLGRVTMLSKFEETLFVDGKSLDLSTNQYPNAIYPNGYKYLKNFRLAPFPIWTFEVEGVEIEKKVFMVYGQNTTVCQWSIKNQSQIANRKLQIELKPLLSFVDYHSLQHENSDINPTFEVSNNLVSIHPFLEMPALYFAHDAFAVEKTGVWYRNFEYSIERERGFDFREDLFQPFALKFDLSERAIVVVSTESQKVFDAQNFENEEIERREALIKTADAKDDFTKQLTLAADHFIVSRGAGKTIIAGYHWFSDWGRDTMIALNGLTLATNRAEIAKEILLEFSKHISEGMLPNRFPDAGETPEYNTVDATLWYFEAVRSYTEKTNDYAFVRKNLYEKLIEIILWHLKGTRYQIHVDTDGLLFAGEKGVQLTWMDAKIGDYVVTPRTGKAVEIQALWYNSLCIMADFAKRFGDEKDQKRYLEMADAAKKSFNQIFWNEAEECLFDAINGEEKDASVRPNQIFAISLSNTMLSIERARKVVKKIEAELLTPFGLRSLSSKDKNYRPVCSGSPFERDSAYHQGTIWAWLIGAFVDAYRKVNTNGQKTENRINEILEGFKNHLTGAGVGQISEIFDGAAPHNPRGCIAQAWSVAEVLRVSRAEARAVSKEKI
ncbi:MAG: amylo-alpha-1,6-glucosidase [Acidobacteria bacterium]|nr:amylo-alpha-1,6-glucosidase [Acidobacteriota bacterium]MCA1636975.1 amylo-alpha-1,6-glucosidase [Acidobacteriota bacterium]